MKIMRNNIVKAILISLAVIIFFDPSMTYPFMPAVESQPPVTGQSAYSGGVSPAPGDVLQSGTRLVPQGYTFKTEGPVTFDSGGIITGKIRVYRKGKVIAKIAYENGREVSRDHHWFNYLQSLL